MNGDSPRPTPCCAGAPLLIPVAFLFRSQALISLSDCREEWRKASWRRGRHGIQTEGCSHAEFLPLFRVFGGAMLASFDIIRQKHICRFTFSVCTHLSSLLSRERPRRKARSQVETLPANDLVRTFLIIGSAGTGRLSCSDGYS